MATIHFFQFGLHEHHGLLTLAAVAREAGHEVHLSPIRRPQDVAALVQKTSADLVGFSILTGMHLETLAVASAVKASTTARVIVGGPHPTYRPQIIEHPAVDIVCRGEGELALVEALNRMDEGRDTRGIPNLVHKGERIDELRCRPLLKDLSVLPHVDRSLLYDNPEFGTKPVAMHFLTGRGCPFACTFCQHSAERALFKGASYRLRSVEHVIGELAQAQRTWGLSGVMFVDDCFGLDPSWTARFLDRYRKEIQRPFSCHLRIGMFDERMLTLLKNAGCRAVAFGVESGSERIRNEVLNRKMSNEQIIEAARMVMDAGLLLETTNMIGLPTETVEEALETIALTRRIRPDYFTVTLFQPLPMTPLALFCLENGLLSEEAQDRIRRVYFLSSVLEQPNIKSLEILHKLFHVLVREPRLESLVLRLIRLPLNKAFIPFFLFMQATQHFRRYHTPPWDMPRMIRVMARPYLLRVDTKKSQTPPLDR